jgi:hypothetical protein
MSSNLSIKAFFDSSSMPLSFMFSLRFAVSVEGIKEKLKTYKTHIDPQKYKTLHKQIKISEQQNERALARLNTRVIN